MGGERARGRSVFDTLALYIVNSPSKRSELLLLRGGSGWLTVSRPSILTLRSIDSDFGGIRIDRLTPNQQHSTDCFEVFANCQGSDWGRISTGVLNQVSIDIFYLVYNTM
jgi:hypothetical protein